FGKGLMIPLEGTPEQQAIVSRRPVVVPSVAELEKFTSPWVRYAIEQGIRSGSAFPLISHGKTLGVLGLVSLQWEAFTADDAALLEQCSSQIAIAVENALTYREIEALKD